MALSWTKYIPHSPFPKQLAFLLLPHQEALFGGAGGGGKSDALLMGALQHVNVPGYAAIIFRRALTDLSQAGSLIDRAHEWLGSTDAKWDGYNHQWRFPTFYPDGTPGHPAILQFGYMQQEGQENRYRSAEFQYIGWDEVTEQEEAHYLFLFSRLRKNVCPLHMQKTEDGSPIYEASCLRCQQLRGIPLRVRAATNPGGKGHRWVKNRFRIWKDEDGIFRGHHSDRPFIPSYLDDNPAIDQKSYRRGLRTLGFAQNAQMEHGDWSEFIDSRFRSEWARYYSRRGDYFVLFNPDGTEKIVPMADFQMLFVTVDPANSLKHGPGDVKLWRKDRSWTVISVWGLTPDFHLLWLDMTRFRDEAPITIKRIKDIYQKWRPQFIACEGNAHGRGIYTHCLAEGIPMREIWKHTDKVVNCTTATVRMEAGRIWLPMEAPWTSVVEDELFNFTGVQTATDDIVDTLADAANLIGWDATAHDRQYSEHDLISDDGPEAIEFRRWS